MLQDVHRDMQHAALLHDVVEDTPHPSDDLIEMGYSQTIIGMLRYVTRDRSDGSPTNGVCRASSIPPTSAPLSSSYRTQTRSGSRNSTRRTRA